ncbi:MAG: 50S ribosomal protein L11 methyltransferase [Ginsengibacter sp.]
MKKYLKIKIEIESAERTEILIAELSEISFYAFEEVENLLNAYIKEEDFDEVKLKNILSPKTIFTRETIKEENWNSQWESGIKPVIINKFVAIRPSFTSVINNVKYDLIITPKMSFGTGHHATTRLMVEMMETINFNDNSVIDFGTGTGVLAILAEKCGASSVIALDLDEWSIKNAVENIEANSCHHIELRQQTGLAGVEASDIMLANINLNVLKNEVSSIQLATKSGSLILASGFLINDRDEITNIFEEHGFVKLKTGQQGDWLAILFKKI